MKKENMIFRLKLEIGGLVNEMVAKLPETLFLSDSTTFLDPSMASGQYVTAIEQRLRKHGHSDENIKSRVFGVEKNMLRVNYAIKKNKLVGTYSVDKNDIPSILICNMKFDCIIGNPPYQTQTDGNSRPIWHLFVENSIKNLEDGGYLCYVHPSGWRNVDGSFEVVKNLLLSKQVEYLEMHDKPDGIKTFKAMTSYDWYTVKNSKNVGNKTTVKPKNEQELKVDLNEYKFIPNGKFELFSNIIAKKGEKTVEILRTCDYHSQKKDQMSVEKIGKFVHPCVNLVRVDGSPKLVYSNVKKGHFGTPKLIWGNGGYKMGSFLDKNGDYALTEFAYAIVDDVEKLEDIKKAFDSKEFRNLMESCDGGDGNINRKVLALFRKDFYKDFI